MTMPPVLLEVFLALMLVWALTTHLPTIWLLFRPGWIRCFFESGDQKTIAPIGPSARLCEELRDLGFDSLGTRVEKRPLWGSERTFVFASSEKHAFADVGLKRPELPIRRSSPWCLFLTPFSDGSWVMTSSFRRRGASTDMFSVAGIPSSRPANLLEEHQTRVAQWTKSSRKPIPSFSREARLEACHAYYESAYGRSLRQIDGVSSLIDLIIVAGIIAAIGYVMF